MNGRKRMLSLLLCVALLLPSLPFTGYAAAETVLTVGEASGLRGQSVQVTVGLNQASGIASGRFTISYDTSRLVLEDAVAGALLSGTECIVNKNHSANSVRVSFAGTKALASGGTLLTLTFTIRSNAPFGEGALTASDVKLMDVSAETVTREFANGSVTVLGASASLSSATVAAGGSTEVALSINGPVASCGGEFTLQYDPAALTVGRITGVQKLGNTPLSFSSSVDREQGVIKVSFLSTVPIDGFGTLCTIKLTASADAVGDKTISFAKLRFFDENSGEIAHLPPEDAVIRVAERLGTIPKLYFTNGEIDSENGTMTVCAALSGASNVCAVTTLIRYDPSSSTLLELSPLCPGTICNPESAAKAEGSIKLSWAAFDPPCEEQKLLKMTFKMSGDSVSALTFGNTAMRDAQGRVVEFFNTYNGRLYDSTQEPQLSLSSANPRLERDYAQSVPVTVTNLSDQSVHYYLRAENPYDDIYLNFVSCGSELEPITILPDETQTISMSVFTQNAARESYTIPVTAFVAYGDEYYANAVQDVTFTCHIPNVSMSFTQGSVEASTLKTEWLIENTGEAITDLTLSLDGTAKDYAAFESGYENYQFASGETISVKLVPDLWKMHQENVAKFTGKLVATGGGKTFSTDILFNTDGRPIICMEAYRMALYQDGNPYYTLQNTGCSSSFEDLTEQNCASFVADDGSFAISTQSEYEYAAGERATVEVSLSCAPTGAALSASNAPLTYSDSRGDVLTQTVQTVIGEADYIELLSHLFSDMGEVFDLEKQATEMAEEYFGVGNMEMKLVMKITDPLLKEVMKTGGDLGEHVQFFLKAAQVTSGALGDVSDALDVASIWANPNISYEDKLAYAALGLAQAASKAVSDPTGGWFSSGTTAGFGLLNSLYRTSLGIGPLSQRSNEELGYYIHTLTSGYQCTNAGRISSGATLTKGMCGFFAMAEVYRRLGDGTLNSGNILQSLGGGYKTRSNSLPALFAEEEQNASLVWMTGRMAAKDNSYINQEATKFSIYVNDRYIGEVQNNGLTEMFCVGLLTDAFVDGSNTIVRKYNTNPGTHYVTAETEYSILVPANSEIAYIGSMEEYSELRPLPDFAVYPENVYIDTPSGETVTAIVGEPCDVKANIYNRGQRGGWVDIVFSCGDAELYRIKNQYIGAFSSASVSFPWVPDGTENAIEVSLLNKTQGVAERRDTNNAASVPVTTRKRSVPAIDGISPREIVIDSVGGAVLLTADVSRCSDVISATFSLDGAPLSGVTSAQYGDGRRYMQKINAADLALGAHEVCLSVSYQDGAQIKTVTATVPISARYHDCDTDGHILLHHPAVKAGFEKTGSIEYWYCSACGRLFADAQATCAVTLEDTLLEKLTLSATVRDVSASGASVNIRLPEGLTAQVLLAMFGADGRMDSVHLCTAQELAAARTADGVDIEVSRGKTVKVFLLDAAYLPMCKSIELSL